MPIDQQHQQPQIHPVAFLLDDLQYLTRARSRAELARFLGVTSASLSLLGRGHRRLTREFLIRVGKALEKGLAGA